MAPGRGGAAAPDDAPPAAALSEAIAAWSSWYLDAGVTDAVIEPSQAPDVTPQASAVEVGAAGEGVGSCGSLDELRQRLEERDVCGLAATATNLCFADGDPRSGLMLIGEAPGAEEDRQGRPFVGPSGRLLDTMLGTIGIDRSRAYLTNVVYWRPPGNRSPSSDEIAACLPYLERQIELVTPRILVSVGGVAAKLLLGVTEGVTRLRGRTLWYRMRDGRTIPMIVLFHPAYLLRQPLHKRLAWRDLLMLREMLAADEETLH